MQEIKGFEPGPYRVVPDLAALRGPGGMVVARFDCMGEHKRILCTNTGGPTAQLFAAAPDLYAECQELARQRDALRDLLAEAGAVLEVYATNHSVIDKINAILHPEKEKS